MTTGRFSSGCNEQVPGRTSVRQLEYQAEALPGCKSTRECQRIPDKTDAELPQRLTDIRQPEYQTRQIEEAD